MPEIDHFSIQSSILINTSTKVFVFGPLIRMTMMNSHENV